MPMFPTDQTKARALSTEQKRARAKALADAGERERMALEHDEKIIRDIANDLRAKQDLAPLEPDEPVNAIICRRGRR